MNKKIIGFFNRVKWIRKLGKEILQRRTIAQSFYSGKIYFNAVEYAIFWMNEKRCETVDREVQDKLLLLSQKCEYFIDVGANIGIMTLSVALRNKNIKVIAYDPNQHLLSYLNRSIIKNGLSDRVKTIAAAISDKSGQAIMNFSSGPFSSHLATEGTTVKVISIEDILEDYKDKRTLIKLDIEGFEKYIIPGMIKKRNPLHKFIIEVHPKGLNNISDPDLVINELLQNNFIIEDVEGNRIMKKQEINDWDNILCYDNI